MLAAGLGKLCAQDGLWSGRLADAFFVPGYRQVSANLALVGPKFGLSCPQVGFNIAQVGPSKAKMAPSWPKLDQVGPKLDPTCLQVGPSGAKLPPGALQLRCLIVLWIPGTLKIAVFPR